MNKEKLIKLVLAIFLLILLIQFNNCDGDMKSQTEIIAELEGESIDWNGVLVSYIGLPLFLVLWLGYKFTKKTKVIPLDKCELK